MSGLGPWVVGITEHRRQPGTARPIRIAAPLPGLGLSESAVPEGAEVVAELDLEVLVDGRLTAIGAIGAPWTGGCRRCLRAVAGRLELEVSEVFELHPADGAETYPLGTDRVDLEPMVRDAVLLALPLAPLCDDDCGGPDPAGHPVGLPGEAAEPPADPRWAALGELRFD